MPKYIWQYTNQSTDRSINQSIDHSVILYQIYIYIKSFRKAKIWYAPAQWLRNVNTDYWGRAVLYKTVPCTVYHIYKSNPRLKNNFKLQTIPKDSNIIWATPLNHKYGRTEYKEVPNLWDTARYTAQMRNIAPHDFLPAASLTIATDSTVNIDITYYRRLAPVYLAEYQITNFCPLFVLPKR